MCQNRYQGLVDKGRFATAADSGYANKAAQREIYRYVFQVVAGGTG